MKTETRIWVVIFLLAGGYLAWRAATVGIGSQYVTEINGHYAPATIANTVAGTARFSLSRTIGIWVAALLTLCIFSFLYRDNPFYKLAESIFVGTSAAYWMVLGFWVVLVPNLFDKLFPAAVQSWAMPGLSPEREQWWWASLIPLGLAFMLLMRLAPRGGWLGVWPLAFIVGTFAGLRLVAFVQADLLSQVRASIIPIIALDPVAGPDASHSIRLQQTLENFVLITGTLVCLVYFFFSVEHKGAVGRISKAGIWVLMITFGAGFGYTVMGRIALLAIRLEFLFDDWLWLIDPYGKRLGM
jgi:hypothetical protein